MTFQIKQRWLSINQELLRGNSMARISVIMGIYNCECETTLPEAIDSIIAQTYDAG